MAPAHSKYTDFEGLRERAVALRRAGLSRRQIRDRLQVDNNDILNRLLDGEPAPEWTKRPNAKDDLRDRARELRLQGLTYDQIQLELGCSKGSISLWVRDLPKPERRDPTEQAKLAARKRWDHELAVRDEERQRAKAAGTAEIGDCPTASCSWWASACTGPKAPRTSRTTVARRSSSSTATPA